VFLLPDSFNLKGFISAVKCQKKEVGRYIRK
jgi:hypothetical protein